MDCSDQVRERLKRYPASDIEFTKKNYRSMLEERNLSEEKIINELMKGQIVFADKETRVFRNKEEVRYRCYIVHSNSRGLCYVLRFNSRIKIITVFPLGRKTLNKYRKRFK